MPFPTTLFIAAAGEVIKELIRGISKKIRNTNDPFKSSVLRELRENTIVLSHRERANITKANIIRELSNERICEAINNDYNFKKLRNRRPHSITQEVLPEGSTTYLNRTCEEMINGVDTKISDLKRLLRLYGENIDITPAVNVTSRFNNLNYQITILMKFINYSTN